MRIGRGEFVFLVGPTGCGKSTCIRLLLKELEASAGEILIAGKELSDMPRSKVPFLRRNIGVVFQDYKLLPNRTVYDNVAYSLQVIGEPRQEIRRKVPDILRLVGPLHQAPQLPRRAVGRRAAARVDRARVREPPAAAAGRRAHRQPRPRDLDRDHAADLPDQPHRHDRRRGHPRQGDGRQDAPPRGRAARGPHRARRAVRPLPPRRVHDRVRHPPARRDGRGPRGPPEPTPARPDAARLLPQGGAARPGAQLRARRSPRCSPCCSRRWCSACSSRSCRPPPAPPTRCATAWWWTST